MRIESRLFIRGVTDDFISTFLCLSNHNDWLSERSYSLYCIVICVTLLHTSVKAAAFAVFSVTVLLCSKATPCIFWRLTKKNFRQILTFLIPFQCSKQCPTSCCSCWKAITWPLCESPFPSFAAVAYHRRRMCHSSISSPQPLEQEVTTLSHTSLAGFTCDLFPVCCRWRWGKVGMAA